MIPSLGVRDAYLDTLPSLLPVPQLDGHIVTSCQYQALRRMNSQATNIVRVGFNRRHLLSGVVVEDAQVVVIRSADEPVTTCDEANATNWDFCYFERLDDSLRRGFPSAGVSAPPVSPFDPTYPCIDMIDDDISSVQSSTIDKMSR